ncbi:MAG TPA: hypothetical protein VGJ07_33140 [Rugosimonospora sp.]|jgi:hypothetical protein
MSDFGRDGSAPGRPSDPWHRDDPYQADNRYQADDPYQGGDPYPTHPGPPFAPREPDGYRGGRDDDHRDPGPRHYQLAEPYQQTQPNQQSQPYQQTQPAAWDPSGQPEQPSPLNPPSPLGPPDSRGPRPPRKSSRGLVITLVGVLVLVLCGGGALALYLLHKGDATQPKSTPIAGTSGSASARASATPSYDPSSIVKGQCVVNDGDENVPRLRVVACAPGSYLVLARFDGTGDPQKCTTVSGSTHDYFYQTSPTSLDFVLCLKQQ